MLASSTLVISTLVAVAQGALMPRQSTGTAGPGCLRCGTEIAGIAKASLQTNGDLLCEYTDPFGQPFANCVFDGTTGAPTTGSDVFCSLFKASATRAAFQCPSSDGSADLVYFDVDSTGNTVCYYGADLLTCQYDPTGEIEISNSDVACPDTAEFCASPSRRAYKGDDNFVAVKRMQAARAPALSARRLALGSMKEA